MIEVTNPNAKVLIAASGTAVSQSREAIRALEKEGIEVGLIKIKSIRPFPTQEIIKATEKADIIVVPEFNAGGWLCREIKAAIDNNSRVIEGPRVYGGMTMPKEIIMNEIKKAIGKNK